MEVLNKIGLVQMSGLGLNRIYENSIKLGKRIPLLHVGQDNFVMLELPASVQVSLISDL